MRKRRWLFDGWPSVVAWVMVVTACDPATPRPGSGRAPVDAAGDRVFLGVEGEGGRGASSAGSTILSKGGTAGVGAVFGTPDAGVPGSPVDGAATMGGGGGPGGRPMHGASEGPATGGGGAGSGGRGEAGGAGALAGARGTGPLGTAGSPGTTGGGGRGGGGAPRIDPIAPPPVVGDLVITELLINPMGTDTGREWIEVLNRAAHAVDLANVHVADAANDAPIDFAVLAGVPPILTAGARAVLIQSADATKNGGVTLGGGGLAAVGGAFGTRVSLNNEADTISLCAGPCGDEVVLDRVAWDADLGTAYEGHALSIDDRGRRCPATAAFGDAGSCGTPGAPNPPCP